MKINNRNSSILGKVNSPSDIKNLSIKELKKLCSEIRSLIIKAVSQKGGHLSSNLGTVELTVALHYVFDSPNDLFIWDVGHQCYTHKILTGRKDKIFTLRQYEGLSGFPSPEESEHDHFYVGHGSTAISQALGLAIARDAKEEEKFVIAIVGDGSLTGGMAFEALNYAGHIKKDLLIILNDNEWAISKTIGGISRYLNRIIINPLYNKMREEFRDILSKLPLGKYALETAKKLEESLKSLVVPGILFEEMGIRYIGPLDGHNLEELISTFEKLKNFKGPVIIHVLTKKGKGYSPSEKEPDFYHSAPAFEIKDGKPVKKKEKTYTQIFSESLIDYAYRNKKIFAITAAMPMGTGLDKFKQVFPERFIDVGMAEQNAITLSSGLAKEGLKPIVCIYSTFIQRAYDQIFHDVCLQNLPVIFCLDRAGIVGEDGPTHHGVFDISFLKPLPNIIMLAPKDGWELRLMFGWALGQNSPVVIRYPKEIAPDLSNYGYDKIKLGKAEILNEGEKIAIFSYGSMVKIATSASNLLKRKNINPYIINLRFAKPIDEKLIIEIARKTDYILVLEECPLIGGIGEQITGIVNNEDINSKVINFAIPDKFIPHGTREELLKLIKLDYISVVEEIEKIASGEKVWQR
jgi:1-deoxy-D-xylulose-5-phosphate synthase